MQPVPDSPRRHGAGDGPGWTAVAGEPASAAWRRLRAAVPGDPAVLSVNAPLDERATVADLVRDPARWGLGDQAGLRPVQLSRGLRQRLALGVTLERRGEGTPALVLEQPEQGLDAGGVAWLAALLRERAAAVPVLTLTWAVPLLRAAETVVLLDGDTEAARGGPDVLDGPAGRALGLAAPVS